MIVPISTAAPDSARSLDAVAATKATPGLDEPAMAFTGPGLVAPGSAIPVLLTAVHRMPAPAPAATPGGGQR